MQNVTNTMVKSAIKSPKGRWKSHSPSGWRKPTPGLVAAERYAQVGERVSVPKTRAIVALKRVATEINLKATDLLLIDILAAFTKPQDWEEGRRPIIWVSNQYLIDQTGFSLPTLKRHARKLVEAGLMAFKDSPNGKRYGKRDEKGDIIEAYGFDLSPLAARVEEFEALHIRLQEERDFCKSLKKTITISRRIIRARIENAFEKHLKGPWGELKREFCELLERLPQRTMETNGLLDLVDWIVVLRKKVEEAFASAFEVFEGAEDLGKQADETCEENASFSSKTTPMGFKNEPHILITNQSQFVIGNKKRRSTNVDQLHTFNDAHRIEMALEKKPGANPEQNKKIPYPNDQIDDEIGLSTLLQACPSVKNWCGHSIRDWQDLFNQMDHLCVVAGISPDAKQSALQELGVQKFLIALALTLQKADTGDVLSPGGYIRGMIDKAKINQLNLNRSVYGLLAAENYG